jgi:hypothetical protein
MRLPQVRYLAEKEYRTEDEGPTMLGAGKLDEDGIKFRFHFLRAKEDGKFGEFWIAEGQLLSEDGRETPIQLALSSQKLKKVLTRIIDDHNVNELHGVTIWIRGYGQGYDREYSVKVLD